MKISSRPLARDISSILVEGGQKTLNTFITNNLFDELVIYTAPIFLGDASIDTLNLKAPKRIKQSTRLNKVKLKDLKMT